MAKYLDIFAECYSEIATTNLTLDEITTENVSPLGQPARRLLDGKMRAPVEFKIDNLVAANIARASTFLWASLVVMVRKKDDGWQMCVNYCRLNSVTKFDCFPLPRLDEDFDAFAGATVLRSFDLAMAYHQVSVKPSDIEKTAFITNVGLFKMQKIPVGLCNAWSIYQRLMAKLLQELIGRICLAYSDNVIVSSKKRLKHATYFRAGFDRSRSAPKTIAVDQLAVRRSNTVPRLRNLGSCVFPDPAKLGVLAD